MTAPRQLLPGKTYLVTRRCAHREFLLTPSKTVNAVFLFLLAVAARRYGIELHAYCVLSNHFHLVVTDPHAQLPAFHQYLDGLVARALNAALGRAEAFWGTDNSYSAVVLASPDAIVEKTAYVLANPVAAGLVRSARLWPGLWSAPEQIGGDAVELERPAHFFDPKGALPAMETLELVAPPGFESAAAFRDQVTAALAAHEERAVRNHGGRFLGVARVLAQNPMARPPPAAPSFGLNPRVAVRDKWKRIEVLDRLAEFLKAYRTAWAARAAGEANVLFPAGTYLLRVLHGVRCEAYG